ncbi:hypothetical protein KKH23_11150 [Patescibacteria group bacterium]|nr:hypothetical protein [Patescibacteria group bacterium]
MTLVEIDRFNSARAALEERGFELAEVEGQLVLRRDGSTMNCYTPGEVIAFWAGVCYWDRYAARLTHWLSDLPIPPRARSVRPKEKPDAP